MADSATTIEHNTAEEVAFKLLREVANSEGKKMIYLSGSAVADRKWILDTYAECLLTVARPGTRRSTPDED